jgi:acyl transferase domain-containing protein
VAMELTPAWGRMLASAGMTSPRGRCHTFDRRADGYARGEACVAGAIRMPAHTTPTAAPLSLRGSATRQDGRSASLTAPSGVAQQALLTAAITDASTLASEYGMVEAHGTGTALGDPIEGASLATAILKSRVGVVGLLPVGGAKANNGHSESAAGIAGLTNLVAQLVGGCAAPNAQLRILNPHMRGALDGMGAAVLVHTNALANDSQGGVSSFGYSGTIAHAVLHHVAMAPVQLHSRKAYKHHAMPWRDATHPFAQLEVDQPPSGGCLFQSPVVGMLQSVVSDHVVLGRIIFPGAGYLELARAAHSSASSSSGLLSSNAILSGVFFLMPLILDKYGHLQCSIDDDGQVEVRSGELEARASLLEATVHCTAVVATESQYGSSQGHAPVLRAERGAHAILAPRLYEGFHAIGLHYGPAYRAILQGWGCCSRQTATSRLRHRSDRQGMLVHPADLDGALQLSSTVVGKGGGLRVPFAIDAALLGGAPSAKWTVCEHASCHRNRSIAHSSLP